MSSKNASRLVLALILMSLAFITGCNSKQKAATDSAGQRVALGAVSLCSGCGQIKGSAECCKPDQVLCSKCGLVKGSPGCCQMPKGSTEPVALCTMCGQVAGSASCCKPGQALCPKCGLVKGSPGCCKIK
ncbi:MAG: hypothetical protein L0Y44_15455 [Phycisphaerales bacterium]|nr:hypothetical protein [Phycisphaerales bacterium]MCI0632041.1 hypothetical protein [Phycisphaerales bacterium]